MFKKTSIILVLLVTTVLSGCIISPNRYHDGWRDNGNHRGWDHQDNHRRR